MTRGKKPVHKVQMTEEIGTSSISFWKNTISRQSKIFRMP